MTQDFFDEPVASSYDADEAGMFDPAMLWPTVELLAELAAGRPALEFAVGTGRVALPLQARGVPVSGIDLSDAMLARLRAKDAAAAIDVRQGDMTTVTVPGSFGLVYLVFNSLGNLTSQDAQVACFVNAAAHLQPGGRFLVELGVPQLQRLPPGERGQPFALGPDHVGIDEYDVVTQQMWSHHLVRDGALWQRSSVPFRYAWPAELDLMARLAGMRLESRWADWQRRAFTADSRAHVSVWRRD